MPKLKNFFREYFSFSLAERKVIYLFSAIILVLIIAPNVYKFFHHQIDIPLGKRNYAAFDSAYERIVLRKQITINRPAHLFNPNNLNACDWISLGLSPKIAGNIEKYIKKGGHFKNKTDLLKIYGFDTAFYSVIEPFICLPKKDSIKSEKRMANSEPKLYPFAKKTLQLKTAINTADSAELDKIPGIGPVFANRIIKYRKLLGGYYSINQLNEVYGVTPELFNKISKFIIVDSSNVENLELNIKNEVKIRKHPYITKYKASLIIKYLKFNGHVKNSSELIQNNILTSDEIQKLGPYLKFSE